MLHIKWENGDHKIDYTLSDEQQQLVKNYQQSFKRSLAEEQAARYRKDPDKYMSLGYVTDLVDQGVYEPYLGAIGGGNTYILHKTDEDYAVQYQYLDAKPIWLSPELGIKADGIYKVTPTRLGYIVKYETDLTNYDSW